MTESRHLRVAIVDHQGDVHRLGSAIGFTTGDISLGASADTTMGMGTLRWGFRPYSLDSESLGEDVFPQYCRIPSIAKTAVKPH